MRKGRTFSYHFVLLGARNVTAMLVGSTALLGSVFISDNVALQIEAELFLSSREHLRPLSHVRRTDLALVGVLIIFS